MTRYEFFRKRIAPVLFLGMVGLIAYDACEKEERHHATVVVDLGDADPRVRSFSAELFVNGELVSHFERRAPEGMRMSCPCKFETAMPSESGELRFVVDVAGKLVQQTKHLHVIEGGTTTVKLDL